MASTANLQGSAPDRSEVAVLLIDVINDLEFPEGDQLLEFAVPMSDRISALCEQARVRSVPVIYVNDNFGRWRSDFHSLVEHCLQDDVRGRGIAGQLRPKSADYFVLKPKHSGFHATPLQILLEHLGARTLILAGMATNICVLFTANDAYQRDYRLIVPEDCSAANTLELHRQALQQMKTVLKAEIGRSSEIDWEQLAQGSSRQRSSAAGSE
jgi:nicotinamidase-related amidase